ncbi:MAG: AAA family ATPase [Selenomonadaceae bacterium]|nr:AAA family ATPase [Selenomonadaceae bacterium]
MATAKGIERSSVIISVFSTTPGIGKTIVAINLAAGLASEGYKVCLADLDLQFGDVLNYLKLTSKTTVAGAQRALLDHPKTFDVRKFLIDYSNNGITFSILPAPLYVFDAYQTDINIVKEIINDLNFCDYIIIDLNSMFSALNLAMLDISTVINYVGVIDFLPALKNYKIGYDTLIRFDYEESKIRLVENRADSQKLINSNDVERLLGEPFYHRLPNDYPSVKKSINTGQPLMFAAPDSKLTKSFGELVGLYSNRPHSQGEAVTDIPTEKNSGGLLSKISNFFGF